MTRTWRIRGRTLDLSRRALIMGIVNVTPDSFSDGGLFTDAEVAIAHGLELVKQGADLLDVGGESTRPGSSPVSLDEELRRVLPVITGLAARTDVPLSIDTSKAEVARQAIAAGAHVVNDVTAGTGDLDMPEIAARSGAGVVLMHMQGMPATMQANPTYGDIVAEIADYLKDRVHRFIAAGLTAEHLVIDPGVGFGKTLEHNIELLTRLSELLELGRPICLGVSRKGFIGQIIDRPRGERVIGSVAIACHALTRGAAQVLRVHDVAATRDAVRMLAALVYSSRSA